VKIHMVKKGDTLYEIAKKYNVDLDKLIASNPQISDPNVIEVGMKVKIPNAPISVIPPTDYLHKHVVVQGDTLWKLGKSWNVPLQALIAANPQLKNPNILMTGEIVYIPKIKPPQALQPHEHQHEHQQPYQHANPELHAHPYPHNKPNTAPTPAAPLPQVEQPAAVLPPYTPVPMPAPVPVPNIEYEMPQMPQVHYQPEMPQVHYQAEMPKVHYQPEMPQAHYQAEKPQAHYQAEKPQAHYQAEKPQAHYQAEKPQIHYQQEMPYIPMPPIPIMHPSEPIAGYPCADDSTGFLPNMQPPYMWEQEPQYMNLFQQQPIAATEVFTYDYSNVPHQAMWGEPTMYPAAAAPYMDAMPHHAWTNEMHAHPFYQQQPVGDCGCGGPNAQSYNQAIPYPYTSQAYANPMQQPEMNYLVLPPTYGATHTQMPYGNWPAAHEAAHFGEFPCPPHGYNPQALTSAYPGSEYPYSPHHYQNVQPYGFPYAVEKPDCGCHGKAEAEMLLREKNEEELKAEISKKTEDANAKKTIANRKKVSISAKATKPVKRSSRPTRNSNKKANHSPWLVR
jgi:morphogenetic protein associated with SpoVID